MENINQQFSSKTVRDLLCIMIITKIDTPLKALLNALNKHVRVKKQEENDRKTKET